MTKVNIATTVKKTALVTGASRGIGRYIASALAREGYAVGVHYSQRREEAEQVLLDIKTGGGAGFVVQADISVESQVEAMFEQVNERFGRIDVLVNNAGWENVHHAIDMPLGDFRRALEINLTGLFQCSQLAARLMEHQGGGSIVNNLSIHDEVPRKGLAHYCSSKAAALMLTKCLALEFADYGIRVNAVSPGAIETDMNREEIEKFGREKFNQIIPLGRVGKESDIAKIVVFLASDAALYVTGATLYADGGYRLTTVPYDPRPPRQ